MSFKTYTLIVSLALCCICSIADQIECHNGFCSGARRLAASDCPQTSLNLHSNGATFEIDIRAKTKIPKNTVFYIKLDPTIELGQPSDKIALDTAGDGIWEITVLADIGANNDAGSMRGSGTMPNMLRTTCTPPMASSIATAADNAEPTDTSTSASSSAAKPSSAGSAPVVQAAPVVQTTSAYSGPTTPLTFSGSSSASGSVGTSITGSSSKGAPTESAPPVMVAQTGGTTATQTTAAPVSRLGSSGSSDSVGGSASRSAASSLHVPQLYTAIMASMVILLLVSYWCCKQRKYANSGLGVCVITTQQLCCDYTHCSCMLHFQVCRMVTATHFILRGYWTIKATEVKCACGFVLQYRVSRVWGQAFNFMQSTWVYTYSRVGDFPVPYWYWQCGVGALSAHHSWLF